MKNCHYFIELIDKCNILTDGNRLSLFLCNIKNNGQGPYNTVRKAHATKHRFNIFFTHESFEGTERSNSNLFDISLFRIIKNDTRQHPKIIVRWPVFDDSIDKNATVWSY